MMFLQICLCIGYYLISSSIAIHFFWDIWNNPKFEFLGGLLGILFGWILFPFIACYYIYEFFSYSKEDNWLNY